MKDDLLLSLVRDDDLSSLSTMLDRKNIFELIGLTRQEIRHSNFLAELLSPQSKLGVGDSILRDLVRGALDLMDPDQQTYNDIDAFTFEIEDLTSTEVLREYRHIDLVIVNKLHKTVIAIENKVDARESDNQLNGYREVIDEHFRGFRKLLIFLTPDGRSPETDDCWISISYSLINKIVKDQLKKGYLNEVSSLLLEHYSELLEKYILNQEKLEELAQKIYLKHKDAIDFIFESRVDSLSELSVELKNNLDTHLQPILIPMKSTKGYIRYVSEEMKALSSILPGDGWGDGNIICWEITIKKSRVGCGLILGPMSSSEVRDTVRDFLIEQINIGKGRISKSAQWTSLGSWTLARLGEEFDLELLTKEITTNFLNIIKLHAPDVDNALKTCFIKMRDDAATL